MSGHDFPHNRKTKTGTVILIGDKWLEDRLQLFGSHAAAVIFDGDQKFFLLYKQLEDNFSTAGDGLHGILQKIDASLL